MTQIHKIYLIVILTVLVSFKNYAQSDSSSATSSLDLMYGYRVFNTNFNNQLNTTKHFNFKTPIQLAGIEISDEHYINKNLDYYGHLSYCQIIPQNIHLQNTYCKLGGFIFGLDYGFSLGFNRKFKVLMGAGFNTGRTKVFGRDFLDQKNPFFSPKVCIQPKVTIKTLVLSIRAEYDFDISNTQWQKTSSKSVNTFMLGNFKQNCFTAFFCIGMLI